MSSHDADRAAAHDLGRAGEEIPRRDENSGSVRRVHLVAGQRNEVEMPRIAGWPDVDAMVRGELRRVDGDARPESMRELGDVVDGGDETGHVRGAADRDEADPAFRAFQRVLDGFEVDVPLVRKADHDMTAAMSPWQQVGVVLHLGDQDLAPVEPRLFRRDPVEGVGRPFHEDEDLVPLVDAQEPRHLLARLFVGLGREA